MGGGTNREGRTGDPVDATPGLTGTPPSPRGPVGSYRRTRGSWARGVHGPSSDGLHVFAGLPSRLRAYIIVVFLGGSVVAGLVALFAGRPLDRTETLEAAILMIAALVAETFVLHLTYNTLVSLIIPVYAAMFWLVPLGWVPLLAVMAIALTETLRVSKMSEASAAQALFNIGQTGLYVGAGAGVIAVLRAAHGSGTADQMVGIVALTLASATVFVVNGLLSATATALQTSVSPLEVFRQFLTFHLTPGVILIVLGATAAVAVDADPLVLPAILLPIYLVYRTSNSAIRLRRDTQQALASLVDVVELRDPYTAGHSRRVAATARALARRLNMTEEEADLIESAGRVHDLGKVAVDPTVLLKTGKLDEEEWAQMRLHPVYGATVVGQFSAYEEGTGLVRHHHERWDGAGYPDGLAGEEIPRGARILAVADTFDALTSDRPYRPGMSIERAAAVLRDGAGTQWDAQIVEAMLGLLAEEPERIPLFQAAGINGGLRATAAA